MEKFEYIRAVSAEVRTQVQGWHLSLVPADPSFVELAEQYLSIAEAEGMPRGVFFEEVLSRAYDACVNANDATGMIARSSLATYDR